MEYEWGRTETRIGMGKTEGKRQLAKPRRRSLVNVRMDLGETGWDAVDWIGLAQNRDK
jgi:hypothetical protein